MYIFSLTEHLLCSLILYLRCRCDDVDSNRLRPHILRTSDYCWCDRDAMDRFSEVTNFKSLFMFTLIKYDVKEIFWIHKCFQIDNLYIKLYRTGDQISKSNQSFAVLANIQAA